MFAHVCEHGEVNSRSKAGLTADDLESLSAGLAAGKRVTVYLRDPMPALGLDAGVSARVLSIDGTTVIASPKGVDDQLPFEASELHRTRAAATSATVTRPHASSASATAAAPAKSPRNQSSAVKQSGSAPSRTPREPGQPAAAKTTRRGKPGTAAVSVTVTSVDATTWRVSVLHGSKKQGKPTEVTADRVARAMRELGDTTAMSAVDGVIDSARAAAQKRIDELSDELETARAALAQLDDRLGSTVGTRHP
ncbi:DUF6319 family protein [Gordonia rhizosphera]|uniref:Translation initiation factor n=1 Tax=Gordonia rhizosphera NBRC 16068 TaxID=1108045 RepID=K6VZQ7_9ACTN|nr:hypothetical protein GORHZ_172_00080 [Gordonia rhizosphera NBRC 16068]